MAFGFGIIGCGMIANFHAKAIADIRDAKLVACFDMIAPAADKLAAATGCRAYHDLDEMLANHDEPIPANFDRDAIAKRMAEMNQKVGSGQ